MSFADRAGWVADPSIGWRVVLTARATESIDATRITARFAALCAAQGWREVPTLLEVGAPEDLPAAAAEPHPAAVLLARSDETIAISAHHAAADGLGMLRILDRLSPDPGHTTCDARGLGARAPGPGLGATVCSRLTEALVSPPARPVPQPSATPGRYDDATVALEVPRSPRTTDLVVAASRALAEASARPGRAPAPVAIAIGASLDGWTLPPTASVPIRDRSALLRLRGVERMDRAAVATAIRTAPAQASPHADRAAGSRGTAGRALRAGMRTGMQTAMRLLGPRLGSSLLVSHLGRVDAPGWCDLAFYPVTAGGSGLSLGAVTDAMSGHTRLTLRGRSAQWHDNGLERLLEAVVADL